MVLKKGIWSRYSTDGTEYAEDRPLKRFSQPEYALGSAQLELPEWLGVPLRQIPPEYEFVLANFNTSAAPHSGLWVYNYVRARERPGLPEWSSSELGARQFWAQVHLDVERWQQRVCAWRSLWRSLTQVWQMGRRRLRQQRGRFHHRTRRRSGSNC